ncbi:MAG: sigma-54 dependent transcriptional regulator [Proteobacteria bacterium]|nr:sigma-54 dependent transcriptional regulator [Pseudomonadota bacterium]
MTIPVKKVLIASISSEDIKMVVQCLDSQIQTDVAYSYLECLDAFARCRYDFSFIDLRLINGTGEPGIEKNYQAFLEPFYRIFPGADLIIMSPQDRIRDAVYLVKAGASDYLTYPVNPSEIAFITERVYERNREKIELDYLRNRIADDSAVVLEKSRSPLMREVYNKILSVAVTQTTVMLHGETGTGKTMVAGLIHNHSTRKNRQFINVHCGAMPDSLIESELFGHEKGAFTGAVKRKMGKFEIADQGTIFLDEIGTITPTVQIKLLKVMQDKTFQKVGGEMDIYSDVRIIAAANDDLQGMVNKGEFRKDLYYRFNVFPIEIPPLRHRIEDIPILCRTFVDKLNAQYQKGITKLHPLVMDAFREYLWPGNIRELENLIERAYILENTEVLLPSSFPAELFNKPGSDMTHTPLTISMSISEVRKKTVANMERRYLKELLTFYKGRMNISAEKAGITPRQLHKLMKKYQFSKNDFK